MRGFAEAFRVLTKAHLPKGLHLKGITVEEIAIYVLRKMTPLTAGKMLQMKADLVHSKLIHPFEFYCPSDENSLAACLMD